MRNAKRLFFRLLATFAVSGLSIIGTGAILGIELWRAVLMAGIVGLIQVIEGIARAYLWDEEITYEDVDKIFKDIAMRTSRGNELDSNNSE
jgi:hypothetical protein